MALLLAACGEQGSVEEEASPLDYLQASPYGAMVLEVHAAPGLSLRDEARLAVGETLSELVDKPDGLSWTLDAGLVAEEPDGGWTGEALTALVEESFAGHTASEAHVLVLVLPGVWSENPEQTLALSWGHQHVAVFDEVLENACEEFAGKELAGKGLVERACEETERVVLLHELGHVLGLVNNGVAMVEDHEDPDHEAHDLSEDCIMHHAVEGIELFTQLRGSVEETEPPLDFGEQCRADLAAAM